MGPRPRNDEGILKIMEYFGGVLCDWLLLDRKPLLAISLTFVLLILFAVTIIFNKNSKKSKYGFEYIMSVTGLIYCIFMIINIKLYPVRAIYKPVIVTHFYSSVVEL